ncbi:hypothetical protein ACF0H5_008207 [Mactra antiquata]
MALDADSKSITDSEGNKIEQVGNKISVEQIYNDSQICAEISDCNFSSKASGCACDEMCGLLKDCCPNATVFTYKDIRINQFSCTTVLGVGTVMLVTKCADEWDDITTKTLCEDEPYINDTISKVIVSDMNVKGLTFKNMHCALCNYVHSYTFWLAAFGCNRKTETVTVNADCTLHFDVPNGVVYRNCKLHQTTIISVCKTEFDDNDIIDKCEQGKTRLIYFDDDHLTFKNIYCARCNGYTERLSCKSSIFSFLKHQEPIYSFRVLVDFNENKIKHENNVNSLISTSEKSYECDSDQLYDPLSDTCRDIICPQHTQPLYGICVLKSNNSTFDNASTSLEQCALSTIKPTEFDYLNATNQVIFRQRVYNETEYIRNGSDIFLCLTTDASPPHERLLQASDQFENYLSLIGLIISIVSLLVTVIIYLTFQELLNIPEITTSTWKMYYHGNFIDLDGISDNSQVCFESSDCNDSYLVNGCSCDMLCGMLNDCCHNVTHVRYINLSYDHFSCVDVSGIGKVLLVTKCAKGWDDTITKSLCEDKPFINDTLSRVIVSDLDIEGLSFKNMYCAECNYVQNYYFWMTKFNCGNADIDNLYTQCPLQLGVPDDFLYRDCTLHSENIVTDCNVDYKNTTAASKCEAERTRLVYQNDDRKVFKNIYCAECNGYSTRLSCTSTNFYLAEGYPVWNYAFSILVDLNRGENVEEKFSDIKKSWNLGNNSKAPDAFKCALVRVTTEEFVYLNASNQIIFRQRLYNETEYVKNGTAIFLCADALGTPLEGGHLRPNDLVETYLSIVGLTISIVALVTTFCSVPCMLHKGEVTHNMRRTVHLHVVMCVTFLLLKCARSDVEGFFQTNTLQPENSTHLINACEQPFDDNQMTDLQAKQLDFDKFYWNKNVLAPADGLDAPCSVHKVRKISHVISFRRDDVSRRLTDNKRRERNRNVDIQMETERRSIESTVRRTMVTDNSRRFDQREMVNSADFNRRQDRARYEMSLHRARKDQTNDRRRDNIIASRERRIVRNWDMTRVPDTRRNERSTRNDRNNMLSERYGVHRSARRESLRVREENTIRKLSLKRRERDMRLPEEIEKRQWERLSTQRRDTEQKRRDTVERRFTELNNRRNSRDSVVQNHPERRDSRREINKVISKERSRDRASDSERMVDKLARKSRERDQERNTRNVARDLNSEQRRLVHTPRNNENRRTTERDTINEHESRRQDTREYDLRHGMSKVRDILEKRESQYRQRNTFGKDIQRGGLTKKRRVSEIDERRALTSRQEDEQNRRRQNYEQRSRDGEGRPHYQNDRRRDEIRSRKLPNSDISDMQTIYRGLQRLDTRERGSMEDKRQYRKVKMEDFTRTRHVDDSDRTYNMKNTIPGYETFLDQGGITRAIVVGFIGILGRGLWQKQI